MPDDVLTEIPAVGLQRESDSPRDAYELLAAPVAITQVQPASPVVAKHSTHFAKDQDESLDIRFGRGFEADLAVALVVSQIPVRRRRHAAMDAAVGKSPKPV
jgi:hypothetical protein